MKKILFLFLLCSVSVSASDLSSFATKLKAKNKAPVKIYKVQIEAVTSRDIKAALVLELTSNKYLGKKLSLGEEHELEELAMRILYQGLINTDEHYNECFKKNSRSSSIISQLGSALSARAGYANLSNYNERDSNQAYTSEKEASLKRLFLAYKSLFEPDSRNHSFKAEEIKEELSLLVGPSTVLELHSLLQRDRRGQIAKHN